MKKKAITRVMARRPKVSVEELVRRLRNVEDNAATRSRVAETLPALPAPVSLVSAAVEAFPMVGDLGLTELKLTDAEEVILSEPVRVEEILIKPTGQPYLSHPSLTRWCCRAFGRFGWALRPVAEPVRQQSGDKIAVVVPYVLYVHGKPVASAYGEHEYWATNADQSWGDALESTVANALRRCLKRIGVGLEMWDRGFLDRFVAEHCVEVRVWKTRRDGGKYIGYAWRLKKQAHLKGELAPGESAGEDAEASQRGSRPVYDEERRSRGSSGRTDGRRQAPEAGHNAKSGEPVTEQQLRRFWVILRNSGREEDQVRRWLSKTWGYEHSKDIRRADYDAICEAIEAPGQLPDTRAGREEQ